MADLYEILGVGRDATPEEIKKSYRSLARESHPDANPDDPDAETRFKELSAAEWLLSRSKVKVHPDQVMISWQRDVWLKR